jgi:DNA helicase-2/ATP-dependent DNA helicase PcrA
MPDTADGWDLLGDHQNLPPLVSDHPDEPEKPAVPTADELLADLNEVQRTAVQHAEGPLVIVAGAGSGKTRVLTRRIAWLVANGVPPWAILAITFTNKAADEMRRRVVELVGDDASRMWVSTFHSACVRILRRHADRIGWKSNFTIYDDGDSRRLLEHIEEDRGIDQKRFPPRTIASAKSDLVDAALYDARATSLYERRISEIYTEYEYRLQAGNAMDFDDLLGRVVTLFRRHQDVLESYQQRFWHILVDEYQDTNVAQNEIVMMLGQARRNVCVVGDTDQSIYRFRGAEMRNLLEFETAFPDATVVLLEQNYRSTRTILDAANAVISNNSSRHPKRLWSDLGTGGKIRRYRGNDEREEASFVASEIRSLGRSGVPLNEIAVFYRTNAQSRALESGLVEGDVPYKIIGGTRFYDRREVRDSLAYLRLIVNPGDEVSLRRVVNVPRRGVGDTTVTRLVAYAREHQIPLAEALAQAAAAGVTGRALAGITGFLGLMEELRAVEGVLEAAAGLAAEGAAGPAAAKQVTAADVLGEVLERSGYTDMLETGAKSASAKAIEAEGRLDNLAELLSFASEYATLEGFLESVSLVAAADEQAEGPQVSLMTLHAAKGLEFQVVFLTGMEEGLFPQNRAMAEPEEMEEERRLCYVGITRARQLLYISHTWRRLLYGSYQDSLVSRFMKEIPEELIEDVGSGAVFGQGRGPAGGGSTYGGGSGRGHERPWDLDRPWDPDRPPAIAGGGRRPGREGGGRSSYAGRQGAANQAQVGETASFSGRERIAALATAGAPAASSGAESLGLEVGDEVVHDRFGAGVVTSLDGRGRDARAKVRFHEGRERNFILSLTPLKRLGAGGPSTGE